ncbi:MAG: PAS domain S-box protein [Actinomycetota bacterium]
MARADKLTWLLVAALALAVAWSAAGSQAEGVFLPAAAALLVVLPIAAFRLGQRHSGPEHGDGLNAVVARLQQEQGILRTFFRALPDMAWIKDAEGRYLACNPLFEEFCGFREDQVIGQTDFAFVDQELAAFFRQKDLEAILADRPRFNEEWITYASDGRRALVETVKAPIRDAEGRPIAVLGIAHDITAAREAADRLEESRRLLQELTAHREEVREEERRRIARNLHEELGQLLGSLRMGLSVQRVWTDPAAFRERLPALLSQVDLVIDGLREAVAELRPNPLNMGIIPALEWLVLDFSKNQGIECTFHGIEGIDLGDPRATALFRIVQESLGNVARHSGADRAEVFLEREGTDLVLRVRDKGKGFDPLAPRPKTFGLLGIWERSVMLGGHLDIRSAPGQGTEIILRFPA